MDGLHIMIKIILRENKNSVIPSVAKLKYFLAVFTPCRGLLNKLRNKCLQIENMLVSSTVSIIRLRELFITVKVINRNHKLMYVNRFGSGLIEGVYFILRFIGEMTQAKFINMIYVMT